MSSALETVSPKHVQDEPQTDEDGRWIQGRKGSRWYQPVYHSSTEGACVHILLEQFSICQQLSDLRCMAAVDSTP